MISTLVWGASENPDRYSYKAILALRNHHHPVLAIGKRPGQVNDVPIVTDWSRQWDIDTVTLYVNPVQQLPYIDSLLALRPRRIIFNPGTENPDLVALAKKAGIVTQEACTLVLLHTGQYHLY